MTASGCYIKQAPATEQPGYQEEGMEIGKAKSSKLPKSALIAVACIVLALFAQGLFFTGKAPSVAIRTDAAAIGRQTPFQVEISESRRGLTSVKAELIQDDHSVVLIDRNYTAGSQLLPWGKKTTSDTLSGTAGLQEMPQLHEGSAILRVTAGRAPTWLRHPDPAVSEITLPVRLKPPSLEVTSTHIYVSQGGCELVTYRVGETARRDGVQSGSWWFPGYPLPGGDERERFALFAAPYDMSTPDIRLVAVDDAGNVAEKEFVDRFQATSFKTDAMNISDAFIGRVVPDILAHSPEIQDLGDPLSNYLAVNRELRVKNSEKIQGLAEKSTAGFLWNKPFQMLPNGKVMATFGEKRTYRYNNETVDTQIHLGYDLASVQKAEIPAPNSGIVLFAGFLGIYGNAVILDHGYGLMSILGHMSSINVKEGEEIARGAVVGRTGATGLAGGDHLHYGILLEGLPVNPVEWSDGHWIRDRIARKLGPAFPFSE
jgi:murein DD-endopeptidase MepM/ murein hydrolase activator NlpD